MAYADFTLSRLVKQFSLAIEENTNLFGSVDPISPSPQFEAHYNETRLLAINASTEKARSEFIIAPVLTEFWLQAHKKIGLHSGVDFPVDPENGLAGVCDYIITRSPGLLFVKAPIILVVEAKNEELKRGYAQCMAEMIAASRYNDREDSATDKTYGVVTTGELWRFLELEGQTIRVDSAEYHVSNLAKILGILLAMVNV